MFDDLKNKARDLAREHSESIDEGIDKASRFVRQRAGDKHAAKVDKLQDKAHHAAERLAGKNERSGSAGSAQPGPRATSEPDMTTPLRNQPRAEDPDRPFPMQP